MSKVSVSAIYDGRRVQLLEPAPVRQPYRVLVTFLEPEEENGASSIGTAAWWERVGTWEDDRPLEATIADIYGARRSRSEPPTL